MIFNPFKTAMAFSMVVCPIMAGAQSWFTKPVGLVNVTVAAGTGTAKTTSVLSFPLQSPAAIAGQSVGRITGLTANSIRNSNAGWDANALSAAATPYLIEITSGVAKGRSFLISASTPNTTTEVVLDATDAAQAGDLTALGIITGAAGDTYSILQADTIANIFGTPGTTGIVGSTSNTAADIVQLLVSGAWRQYYYNTTSNNWLRIGPGTVSNNVVIRPDTGVIYSRLANTPLAFSLHGKVPDIDRRAYISNLGITFLSSSWPVDLTLATSGITSIPGWVSSTNSATSDVVQIMVSGAWRQYYYNGTNWIRIGPNTVSNAVTLSLGNAVLLSKTTSSSGFVTLQQSMPYSL